MVDLSGVAELALIGLAFIGAVCALLIASLFVSVPLWLILPAAGVAYVGVRFWIK